MSAENPMSAEDVQKLPSETGRYVRAEFFWVACAVAVLASAAAAGSWFYIPRQISDARVEKGVVAELAAAVNAGDYGRAVPDLQRLAAEGRPQAQALLAELYRTGGGIPRDLEQAFRWTLAAAKGGDAAAQVAVAEMYAHGYGVQQDLAMASEWTAKAEAARKDAAQNPE